MEKIIERLERYYGASATSRLVLKVAVVVALAYIANSGIDLNLKIGGV